MPTKDTKIKLTTVRLPIELHSLLRGAAIADGVTSEAIIKEALRRELNRRNFGKPSEFGDPPNEWGPALAEIFLQFLPTPCSIKDENAKIVWVNFSYEDLCRKSLSELEGKSIEETGLLDDFFDAVEIEIDIRKVFEDKIPREFTEGISIKGQERILIRAQRFLFCTDRKYLGDFSFDEKGLRKRKQWSIKTNVADRLRHASKTDSFNELFIPFLETAPISIALKRPVSGGNDTTIVWHNKVYGDLVRLVGNNEELIDRTTREILNLPDGHEILEAEKLVVTSKQAVFVREQIHELDKRWSLRFPIFDIEGLVKYVGVVSPEFSVSKVMTSKAATAS
jgi:hypothetical protein